MIQKAGDYYIYEDDSQKVQTHLNPLPSNSSMTLEAIGNVKQKIHSIRDRFNQIKKSQLEAQQKSQKQSQLSIFQKITSNQASSSENLQNVDIQIYIPEEILKLDQKLSKIEQRLKPNQIMRRKIQTKGTLVQRIKLLQEKLKAILQKSSEIIVTNIQNYCAALDDKDDYLKILFLREAHGKVKGLKDQINILQGYLKSLNSIQTKIKAIEPVQKTVKTHNEVVELRKQLNKKISDLFAHMKQTYVKVLQQLESINV